MDYIYNLHVYNKFEYTFYILTQQFNSTIQLNSALQFNSKIEFNSHDEAADAPRRVVPISLQASTCRALYIFCSRLLN